MADGYGGTNDSGSRAAIHVALWVAANDEANNRSLVEGYIDIYDNAPSLGGYGTGSWGGNVNGWGTSGSLGYDFTGNSGRSYRVWGGQFWVGHGADGRASAYLNASFSGSSPVGYAEAGVSISSDAGTMANYTRLPYAPGAPGLTRSSDGATITVTSAVGDGRGLGITDYHFRTSTDGSNYGAAQGMGTGRVASFAATTTATYWVQTRCATSEGWSDWGSASAIVGVPSTPTPLTLSRTGRNVTVTATAATGTGILDYQVQYSIDGGATWSALVVMSGTTYTYTMLQAGKTHIFRVFARNSIGFSAAATSASLFVPAGGRPKVSGVFVQSQSAKVKISGVWYEAQSVKAKVAGTFVDGI